MEELQFSIEDLSENNIEELTTLMLKLWPECSYKEEFDNCHKILNSPDQTCFLAAIADRYVAFIQLSLRKEYVEGATASPVTYIEGLYVEEDFRNKTIGQQLLRAGEEWAKGQGCLQCASDTEINNVASLNFHIKAGYTETKRAICFIKNLK